MDPRVRGHKDVDMVIRLTQNVGDLVNTVMNLRLIIIIIFIIIIILFILYYI
jgi:hypothetical protein